MATARISHYVLITFREKRGRGNDLLEIVEMMEERAEKRYIQMEKERRAHELELENKRMEMETQSNERMMNMFASLMQQMVGGGAPPSSFYHTAPPPSFYPPFSTNDTV